MGNKVAKFEDLIAWQKARELTCKIYQISRQGDFAKDFRPNSISRCFDHVQYRRRF